MNNLNCKVTGQWEKFQGKIGKKKLLKGAKLLSLREWLEAITYTMNSFYQIIRGVYRSKFFA
jgi:hypothetical protein